MKTAWLEKNASIEEIARVLKMYPSYRNNYFKDVVSQKEKVYRNNPVIFDGDNHLFERLHEVAELPNNILAGHTYRTIFNFIRDNNIEKEDLLQIYENSGKITPIWVIESFKGPLVAMQRKGPYTIIFFNETPTE